jgi:hypothetical protein
MALNSTSTLTADHTIFPSFRIIRFQQCNRNRLVIRHCWAPYIAQRSPICAVKSRTCSSPNQRAAAFRGE